jgi:membrane-bound lytic murein transglycosylase A
MILQQRRMLRVVTRRGAVAATLALAVILTLAPAADAARKKGAPKRDPLKIPNSAVELAAWESVEGWAQDNHAEAIGAFLTSCRALMRHPAGSRTPVQAALADICGRAIKSLPLDDAGAQAFFEKNFRPVRIAPLGEKDGFFTGYYEPIVEGARFPSDKFTTPLYRRPSDMLVTRIRHSAKKGKAGKRVVKKSAPYYNRDAIEDGAIAGRGFEIAYVNVIEAFFAQIQGSVRVRLEDGSMLRLNYDAQNGHPYTAVGRFLVERKIYTREEISMQKIREWMEANPEEGAALRRQNKSYVFFKETALGAEDEPPGAQGVALTPGRSIAVDRNLHTYGMPFFIDAVLPIQSEKPDTKFRRLMVAQDTGGAIIGPARADIYLGAGDEAARAAGRFKQFGRFVMLVPNELDPARLERGDVPLPRPRPKLDDDPIKMVERREEPAAPAPTVAAPKPADPKTAQTRPEARVIDKSVPLPKASPLKKKQ